MSVFENKKVFIKFLYKDKSLPKKHPLYGGKHEKATLDISAPHFEGKPIKIFNDDELKELELAAQEDLSFRKDNDFWRSGITRFSIPREGKDLDLTKWVDVIRYRIVTHDIYKDIIGNGNGYAPTCKWAIFTDEAKSEAVKLTDKRFDNIKFYGKYEDNIEVLRYIYNKITGGRIAVSDVLTKVQSRIKELLETEPIKLSLVSKEENLSEKGLVFTGQMLGIVEKTNMGYMFNSVNGIKKLFKGDKGDMESAATFLADPTNQEIKFEIQGKIEANKK